MPGLFGVLDIASRALMVNQRGVAVTGHNIANANTPGYSRQRQVLEASHALVRREGHLGTGVEQVTIERVQDRFLQRQLIGQDSRAAATGAQADALAQIEQVLNEQGGDGVAAAVSRLYDSFSDMATAATPGAPVERQGVVTAARTLIDTLHAADVQLRQVQAGSDQRIRGIVEEVNSITSRLGELNQSILEQDLVAPANDLKDKRDLLLRELAQKVDIQTFERSDATVVVGLSGGFTLVEGSKVRSLEITADTANPFDPRFVRVLYQDESVLADVTEEIGGGELGGELRVRDAIAPAAIRSLDTLAYNLAVTVNAVHAAGTGLDGSVGNFFEDPPAVEDTARDLQLESAVVANPDVIAAGLSTAAGDNRNALALADLRDARGALFLPGDPPGPASGPSRSVLEQASAVVSDIGQQARSLEVSRSQQEVILTELENRRDAVSGVSLDEEVTQLIELQAAFQANARMIGTVQVMLDDLLAIL